MNRGPQLGPQYPRPAVQTILATALPSGSQLTSNPLGQLVDSTGNVVVDASGTPLTLLSQVIAAQQGVAPTGISPIAPVTQPVVPAAPLAAPPVASPTNLTQVPSFGPNGQIVTDANGNPIMLSVPSTSPLARLVGPKWQRTALMVLGLALTAAAVYGAAYFGAKAAIRRVRIVKHEERHSRRSKRSSRRAAAAE